MKRLGYLLIFFFATGLSAQPIFQKLYGVANLTEWPNSLIRTSDGGYAVIGYESLTSPNIDFYVVKTTTTGAIQWGKKYGGTVVEIGWDIKQTADGGYILCGETTSFGSGAKDIYLVKITSSGIVQWSRTFGGVNDDEGHVVHQTPDKGFVIGGTTQSFGSGTADFYLVKTDSSGNLQWTKTYGGTGVEFLEGMTPTSDGGYALSGLTDSFGVGSDDIYVVKTDSLGNLQWSKTFGGAQIEESLDITQTFDKGYAITGFTRSFGAGLTDVFLLKADSVGSFMWSKAYGGLSGEMGYGIKQTPDSGFIVSGSTTSFGAGYMDEYVVRTDTVGNLIWSKAYGSVSSDDHSGAIQLTSDGGFISCGMYSSDFHLLKMDPSGNSGCHQANAATIVTNGVMLTTNPSTQVSFGALTTTPNTSSSNQITSSTLCFTVGENDIAHSKGLFSFFPNPSNGNFLLTRSDGATDGSNTEFQIYNSMGKLIYCISFTSPDLQVTLNNVADGMYFYHLRCKDHLYNGKIIIAN